MNAKQLYSLLLIIIITILQSCSHGYLTRTTKESGAENDINVNIKFETEGTVDESALFLLDVKKGGDLDTYRHIERDNVTQSVIFEPYVVSLILNPEVSYDFFVQVLSRDRERELCFGESINSDISQGEITLLLICSGGSALRDPENQIPDISGMNFSDIIANSDGTFTATVALTAMDPDAEKGDKQICEFLKENNSVKFVANQNNQNTCITQIIIEEAGNYNICSIVREFNSEGEIKSAQKACRIISLGQNFNVKIQTIEPPDITYIKMRRSSIYEDLQSYQTCIDCITYLYSSIDSVVIDVAIKENRDGGTVTSNPCDNNSEFGSLLLYSSFNGEVYDFNECRTHSGTDSITCSFKYNTEINKYVCRYENIPLPKSENNGELNIDITAFTYNVVYHDSYSDSLTAQKQIYMQFDDGSFVQ